VSASGPSPVYRRTAVNFEKVFVVGYDTDAYMSSDTGVLHVGPNARSFIIGAIPGVDKPVVGGLVMGFDGAVLGVCGSLSATTAAGLGYVCWPLPNLEAKPALDVRGLLAVKFPFLNLAAWEDGLLEEVFVHSSFGRYRDVHKLFNAGNKPLANVGDNAAKIELYDGMRQAAVPHAQWSGFMQTLQSNVAFAKIAWKFGLAECMVVGHGAVFPHDSKAYADLVEALLGAAFLVERRSVFRQLCDALGILHTDPHEKPRVEVSGWRSAQDETDVVLTTPGVGEDAQSSFDKRTSLVWSDGRSTPIMQGFAEAGTTPFGTPEGL